MSTGNWTNTCSPHAAAQIQKLFTIDSTRD
jgi:hypothetical protein